MCRMSTYKGNKGNLMQHWTLCELLCIAQDSGATSLNYIDAHAMGPLARERTGHSVVFDRVRAGLPGQGSCYETAWHSLDPSGTGYPNSAVFVREVWKGQVSMLLCETDGATVANLKAWAQGHTGVKIIEGDWRETFKKGVPGPSQVELPDDALTLISFDPDMYDRRRLDERNPRHLYPGDLELTLRALDEIDGGVLIQLSTYGRGNRDQNPQGAVLSSVNEILVRGGFSLAAVVWTNRDMMSLVYARNVGWSAELADLPGRFTEWLAGVTKLRGDVSNEHV